MCLNFHAFRVPRVLHENIALLSRMPFGAKGGSGFGDIRLMHSS